MLARAFRGTIETCDEVILQIFSEHPTFSCFGDAFWLAEIFCLDA